MTCDANHKMNDDCECECLYDIAKYDKPDCAGMELIILLQLYGAYYTTTIVWSLLYYYNCMELIILLQLYGVYYTTTIVWSL